MLTATRNALGSYTSYVYFRASRADLIASHEVLASPNSIRVPGMKNIGFGTSADQVGSR